MRWNYLHTYWRFSFLFFKHTDCYFVFTTQPQWGEICFKWKKSSDKWYISRQKEHKKAYPFIHWPIKKKLILKMDENIQFLLSQNGLQLFLVFETVKTKGHKGSLISEGILTLVPLTKKVPEKGPNLIRKFEFPTLFTFQ